MTSNRLEKLQQKKAQLETQIKGLQAREQSQARKNNTRKKIIAGALALHHLDKNPDDPFSRKLLRLLDEYVTKPYERKLFDLPALLENSQNNVANDRGNNPNHSQGTLKDEFQVER